MELWENFCECLVPIFIRISFFYLFNIKFSFLYAILLTYLLIRFYRYFMLKFFKLKSMTGVDLNFIAKNFKNRYQICSVMTFKNFNIQEMYKFLIENQIKKIPKFRYKLVKRFFEYYWKEYSIEESSKQIQIINPIKDDNGIITHIQKELNNHINIFKDFPYKVHIAQLGNNIQDKKGVVFLIYDHILTDGLGLISTICSLSKNYTPEMFPKVMKNLRDPTFFEYCWCYFTYPFLGIYYAFYFLFTQRYNSPLYVKKPTGKTIVATSKKEYNLKDFEYVRKTCKISFNDLMVSVISMSMGDLIKMKEFNKFSNKKRMRFMLPLGRKKLPKDIYDLDLDNKANGVFCSISVLKELTKENFTKINKEIRKHFSFPIQFMYLKALYLSGYILSWPISLFFTDFVTRKIDLSFTNVPGPTKELIYGNSICDKTFSIPFAGKGIPFMPLVSYNGKFRFSIGMDEASLVKPQLFLDLMCANLDKIIEWTKEEKTKIIEMSN